MIDKFPTVFGGNITAYPELDEHIYEMMSQKGTNLIDYINDGMKTMPFQDINHLGVALYDVMMMVTPDMINVVFDSDGGSQSEEDVILRNFHLLLYMSEEIINTFIYSPEYGFDIPDDILDQFDKELEAENLGSPVVDSMEVLEVHTMSLTGEIAASMIVAAYSVTSKMGLEFSGEEKDIDRNPKDVLIHNALYNDIAHEIDRITDRYKESFDFIRDTYFSEQLPDGYESKLYKLGRLVLD